MGALRASNLDVLLGRAGRRLREIQFWFLGGGYVEPKRSKGGAGNWLVCSRKSKCLESDLIPLMARVRSVGGQLLMRLLY